MLAYVDRLILFVFVVVVVFDRGRGGLIFSPLILLLLFFFWGGGIVVESRREFFGSRPNSIIPIITWNPEYPPHPWSQAISIRLYTFTTFSLKTITANTAVAFIREAYLTQEVLSWARITVAKVLLESIILSYRHAYLAPYFKSLNSSKSQRTTFTVFVRLSPLCIPNNQMFCCCFRFLCFWGENDFTPYFFIQFLPPH